MDSSVIFLALIGVWLVYLVPTWLSRREEASESRVDDRFSESMRLLGPRRAPTSGRPAHGYLLPRTGQAIGRTDLTGSRIIHGGTMSDGSGGRSGTGVRIGLTGMLMLTLTVCMVLVGLALAGIGSWLQAAGGVTLPLVAVLTLRWRVRRRGVGSGRAAAGAGRDLLTGQIVTPGARVGQRGGAAWAEDPLPEQDPSDPIVIGFADGDDIFDEEAVRRSQHDAERAAATAAADARDAEQRRRRAAVKPGEWLPVDVPLPSYLLKPAAPPRVEPLLIDLRDHVIDLREEPDPLGDGSEHGSDEWVRLRRASGS